MSEMVCETHAAIISQGKGDVLNLVATNRSSARETTTQIAAEERSETITQDLDT